MSARIDEITWGFRMLIEYPYLPAGRSIEYAPATNEWMRQAKEFARVHSLDDSMPGAAVIVRGGEMLGIGANGSDYHRLHGCERVRRGIPTGQGYELCEGCHPKNHSEETAIQDARKRGNDVNSATMYLWGHWWCCEPCWKAMIAAGIDRVFLLERSERLFNKAHPLNIIGRQFEGIA